ncbi:MAG: helix-turn-helix transcriptional regulator [Bdellovibrionia bacterium]
MAVHWRLKTYLASQHGIYSATELQKKICSQTGVLISLRNVCDYLNGKPKNIRLTTMEILCGALNCKLSDILEVTPKHYSFTKTRKLEPEKTPFSKRAIKNFPDPDAYKT